MFHSSFQWLQLYSFSFCLLVQFRFPLPPFLLSSCVYSCEEENEHPSCYDSGLLCSIAALHFLSDAASDIFIVVTTFRWRRGEERRREEREEESAETSWGEKRPEKESRRARETRTERWIKCDTRRSVFWEREGEKSEKLRDERRKKGRYSGKQCETLRAADSASETIVCKWREEVKVARSTRIAEATKDAEGGDI